MFKLGFVCADDFMTLNFTRSLVRRLRPLSGSVEIVAINSSERGFAEEIARLGMRHVELPIDRFVNPFADVRYAWRLFRICRRERFDAVVNWTTKPVVYGAALERIAGVPDVTTSIRGLGVPFSLRHGGGAFVRAVLLALYRLAFACSDRVWFTNPDDVEFFVRRGLVPSRKVLLTRNAIDIEHFRRDAVPEAAVTDLRARLGLEPRDRVVLMVGRLLWSKGVREFVTAAERLTRERAGVRFVLVGGTDARSPDAVPRDYIESAVESRVLHWVGFQRDVRPYYRLAEVAVLPTYLREGGYPRALLEPMAFGVAVVAADTPHAAGAVEHERSGLLVPPHDGEALAAAIARLLDDTELRTVLGARARAKVEEQFDDRDQAEQFLETLELPGFASSTDRARRNPDVSTRTDDPCAGSLR